MTAMDGGALPNSLTDDTLTPSFSFQPATPGLAINTQLDEIQLTKSPHIVSQFSLSTSPAEDIGFHSSSPLTDLDPEDLSDQASDPDSTNSSNILRASIEQPFANATADADVAGLLAFSTSSPQQPTTLSVLTHSPSYPSNPVSTTATTATTPNHRHHSYGSALSLSDVLPDTTKVSYVGPLRNRRGQHLRTLSINSGTSSNTSGPSLASQASGDEALAAAYINDENHDAFAEMEQGLDSPERTVQIGDHGFKIPLISPTIAPQLQSNIRLTSTGKPSHARKVPEGHVKRPRNAFILFRSYACTSNLLPQTLGINDHRQVSRIVGQLWKGLKPEEKLIWEKKAAEEKEAHKLKNPNYRYRPVYRRENVVRRRRRRPADEEEVEEEERKCEVVARVLLEGREVSEDQLQREVEDQRTKDQEEGRDRSRSRSRSRSKSVHRTGGGHSNRPNSAPPGSDNSFEAEHDDHHHHHPYMHETSDGLLRPSNIPVSRAATRSRAKTMPTNAGDFTLPPVPFYPSQHYSLGPHHYQNQPMNDYGYSNNSSLPGRYNTLSNGLGAPSPRTAANMQQLFEAVSGDDASLGMMSSSPSGGGTATAPAPFDLSTGFKMGQTDNVSLISPSFSRKFSLGRWEIPQSGLSAAAPTPGLFVDTISSSSSSSSNGMSDNNNNVPVPDVYNTGFGDGGNGGFSSTANHVGVGSDGAHHSNYTYEATQQQPFAPSANSQQYASTPAPTYVYLTKDDAQNPEIVNHYLSQGYGVSYDA